MPDNSKELDVIFPDAPEAPAPEAPPEDLTAPVTLTYGQFKYIKEFFRDYHSWRADTPKLAQLKELFGPY